MKDKIIVLVYLLIVLLGCFDNGGTLGINPTSTPLSKEDNTIYIPGAESCGPDCEVVTR